MDVVCRDADSLGVKWREHFVKNEDAIKRFEDIYDISKRAKYKVIRHSKNAILVNQDYIELEK